MTDTLIVTERRTLQKGLAIAIPPLLFGLLVTAQWATFAQPRAGDVAIRYVEPLVGTISRLQDEQAGLKRDLAGLRDDLDALQRRGTLQNSSLRDLQGRIDDLRATAGLTPRTGEGVRFTLAVAKVAEQPRDVCLAPDITDLVGVAWRGGAVAVAVGGERMVASSSVYCVGGTIVVNGGIVSPPYVVSAVGPPASILGVFGERTQLVDLKRRRDLGLVQLQATRLESLSVPAYSGPVAARSAVAR